MNQAKGLTIIEVLVAMAMLAILGASLVGVLPLLSANTRASTIDTNQSQLVYEVFERIASDWSNITAWTDELVTVSDGAGGTTAIGVAAHVAAITGNACSATITEVEVGVRKRVVISCGAAGNLPARELRAEYGNPNV